MNGRELEIIAIKDECCGTETCPHTRIQHGNHTGWLKDGKLRCRTHDSEPLFECSLSFDTNLRCELVAPEDGHVHGPNCGHEMVPHGNHFDYLVGSRLHHVVDQALKCCEKGCLGDVLKSSVVDHGYVRVRRRASLDSTCSAEQDPLIDRKITTDMYAAGICCPSEVPVIHRILKRLPGVLSVEVMVMAKNVRVEHDPSKLSPAVLVSALNGAGLQASLGKRDLSTGSSMASLPPNVILSGIFLAVSLLAFFSSSIDWLKFIALPSVVVGCPLIVIRACASVRRMIVDINVLMLISSIGAIALQEYHEAAAIVFLFGISQWIEDKCMGKARRAVSGLRELQPDFAVSAGNSEHIPVDKIEVDDLLIVRPGDRVAVDGIVISGVSAVDESLLTGESRPVGKREGDTLLSGSVNSGSGSLKMRATSRVTDSTVSQLAKKVEETAMQRSPMERTVETFAKFYTPVVVMSAATVAVLPLIVTSLNWTEWLKISLVLLVTACPCALVISTPVTTVCGISRAAQKSVLIKGGTALETLGRLKALTFDKTGTLTEGHCDVMEVRSFNEMSEKELMNWAASIEVHSSHPLAAAIVGSAAASGQHYGTQAISVDVIPGRGLKGIRDGASLLVGNWRFMLEQDVSFGSGMDTIEQEVGEKGQKACFVAVDQRLMGVIIIADRIRPGAKSALASLQRMKLHLGVLTGDGPVSASFVATSVGLDSKSVHSGLIAEEKSGFLEHYRHRYGPVGHVGDGINDSLALAAADVGIAMGVGGSTMAVEAADVALFSNEISCIETAIKISRKVRVVIIQNIIFSISVKIAVIVLAFVWHVQLWHAVIADVGSALAVIFNGLRLLRFERLKHSAARYQNPACARKTENKDSSRLLQKGSFFSKKQENSYIEIPVRKQNAPRACLDSCCSKKERP